MTRRSLWGATVVTVLLLVLGVTGCGVGATDRPVDEGDAATGSNRTGSREEPPEAGDAQSVHDLVRNFLQASAGGLAAAPTRVRDYLTKGYQERWLDPLPPDNPPLTVVRVLGDPEQGPSENGRTPFTVKYEPIGTMTDFGRVDDLVPLDARTLIFWVVEEDGAVPRIDDIEGWPDGQLLLSDLGLTTYYQVQPIYFWDRDSRLLVPDVRYLPKTLNADQRAARVLAWLSAGPSPAVSGTVQLLPPGISFDSVGTEADGRLAVDLAGTAAGADDEALRRLTYQLQWSLESVLTPTTTIELRLDSQPVPVAVGPDDYRGFNHGYSYRNRPTRYDIANSTVVPDAGGTAPTVLSSPANANVVWAAVGGGGTQAAFVRADQSGRRFLQLVVADAPEPRATQVPKSSSMGRPVFVPDSGIVLVPSDGRLYAVSVATGAAVDAAHGLTNISSFDVSPDGRRVAFVAGGTVYVAALTVGNDQATVATRRELLAGRLSARAVAWTSASTVLVAGTSSGAQALWEASADGVLVENKNSSSGLGGLVVNDLVSYPKWIYPDGTASGSWEDAYAFTPQGIYSYRVRFSEVPTFTKPFYGS